MDKYEASVLGRNLRDYLDVLVENYYCKTKKRPSILVELSKDFWDLSFMNYDDIVSKEDVTLKVELDNVLRLLETSSIDSKDLKDLKSNVQSDWYKFINERTEKVKAKVDNVLKLMDKASKKIPELNRSAIRVHENNMVGREKARKQNYFKDSDYFVLHRDRENKTSIDFTVGLKDYISFVNGKLNVSTVVAENALGINTKKGYVHSNMGSEEQKVIEDYEKFVREGKVDKIADEPLTFFAKFGFKPLKKQVSEKEIIEKLAQSSYVLDLIDYAIDTIKKEKKELDFSQTLSQLNNLKSKYSVIVNKARDDFKSSNYGAIKEAVENQRKIDYQNKIDKLNREKCKLLYNKILKSNDEKEKKQLLEKIRFIELDNDIKNEIMHDTIVEYELAQENKKMEGQIIREELQERREFEAEIMNARRKRAIEELKLNGAFDSQYYEHNGDIRDGMTSERVENMISQKMEEMGTQKNLSKNEQALQDLKDLGYMREDATLKDLKPYEHDALLAQMRINSRAEVEKNGGYGK